MTEEQIKQKAEAEADKVIIGSGMDRASVIHLKHLLTTLYTQGYHTGAIVATKELEKEIHNLKADRDLARGCYADLENENADLKEAYQKGAISGYNKANEWHYVKDEKPKDNEYVLIYTDIKNVYIARLVKDDYFITNKGGFVQMSAVIAWKEIVLPKESE